MNERERLAYEIERELAARLRCAPKADRPGVAREVYADLYRRVHWHPDLTITPERRAAIAAGLSYTYERWVGRDGRVLEIGAGSCDVLRRLGPAHPTTKFVAIDVVRDPVVASGRTLPANVVFLQAGAVETPFREATFDFVFCSQVLEHFHPDDVADHIREVARVLRPGGWFGLDTPNRLSGPHDISRGFTKEATGLHLKEWTHRELVALLRSVGFGRVCTRFLPGRLARGIGLQSPGAVVDARWKCVLEHSLQFVPGAGVRRRIARVLGIDNIFLYGRLTS